MEHAIGPELLLLTLQMCSYGSPQPLGAWARPGAPRPLVGSPLAKSGLFYAVCHTRYSTQVTIWKRLGSTERFQVTVPVIAEAAMAGVFTSTGGI